MLLATFRSTIVTTAFFFFLMMTYMLLMIGSYIHSINCQKGGGGLGLVAAAIGYYAATSALITPHVSYAIYFLSFEREVRQTDVVVAKKVL